MCKAQSFNMNCLKVPIISLTLCYKCNGTSLVYDINPHHPSFLIFIFKSAIGSLPPTVVSLLEQSLKALRT